MKWNFNYENKETNNLINPGNYRVEIISAKETCARNGNEGIEIIFHVDRCIKKLKYFIWYNLECPERTNKCFYEFFESFNINENEIDSCEKWVGKKGAVNVILDEYKGYTISKVAFCIKRDCQKNLPNWEFAEIENSEPFVSNTKPSEGLGVIPHREFDGFSF